MPTDTYNSGSGTWVAPADGTLIIIGTGGGGGGGAGGDGGGSNGASGGGGGGSFTKTLEVTEGQSFSWLVGSGGSGGIGEENDGTAGDDTTVDGCVGGGGGAGRTGEINPTPGALGGVATGGDTNTDGLGSAAVTSGNNGSDGGNSGSGGSGGLGGIQNGAPAEDGNSPGGGGGGGADPAQDGGAGADGEVSFNFTESPVNPCSLSKVDPFFRKPIRTHKGGGTRCTSCEIIDECSDAGKCILPLVCATIAEDAIANCSDPVFINADAATGAVYYNCELRAFDFSVQCDYEVIDLLMTYEIIYEVQYAVLRSTALGVEVMVEFTDEFNARCPTFDFGIMTTRPYDMVSIGQQMCIDSGPDDCTAGRCLPRYLCADVLTVAQPDEPFHTVLEWYTNDVIQINDICCCNANCFPELLVARIVNFDEGCSCIAPKRHASLYYPVEHAGAELNDPGAMMHLRHRIASESDLWVTGYPFVTVGSNVWVSEAIAESEEDLVLLCPAPLQIITEDTRTIYGRMILWCDLNDGQFKAAFETVERDLGSESDSESASASDESEIPYDLYNPFSTVTYMDSVDILACNPFSVRCRGIYEDLNCQTLSSVDGAGNLEIVVNEFTGWVGDNPVVEGGKIIVYTERVNAAAPAQTVSSDCFLKMHLRSVGEETFKNRADDFYIDKPWPEPVWDSCIFPINEDVDGEFIASITIYPQACTGCVPQVIDDPYTPRADCCDVDLPSVLYVTAVEILDCPCADGTIIPILYDSTSRSWVGSGTFGGEAGCSCDVTFELICRRTTGGYTWEFNVYFGEEFFAAYNPGEPENQSYQCNPFLWETRVASNNSCCDPSFAASQFYWVITA